MKREPITIALGGVGALVVLAGAAAILLSEGGTSPLPAPKSSGASGPSETSSSGAKKIVPDSQAPLLIASARTLAAQARDLERLPRARAVLRDSSAPPAARAQALRLLAELAPEEGVRLAMQLLGGGAAPELDAGALRLLERFAADLQPAAAREVERLVRAVLARAALPEAALAAGALLDALISRDPALVDPRVLEGALPSVPLAEGRVAIVRALGLLRGQDGEAFLAYCEQLAANDPAPAVRAEAVAQGLRDAARQERGVALAIAVIRRDPKAKSGVIRALASLDDVGVKARLGALFLSESQPEVMRSLARALAARPNAIPPVIAKAAFGAGPRATAAVDALGQALTKDRESLLRKVLREGASAAARSSALLALYQHERLDKRELLALKADSSPLVRKAAEASLREGDELPPADGE